MRSWVVGWCRFGAVVAPSGRIVSPMVLQSRYSCGLCGGGVVVRTVQGADGPRLRAECADCQGTVFLSEWAKNRGIEHWERITRKLPPHLREIADRFFSQEAGPPVEYDQAVRELYSI